MKLLDQLRFVRQNMGKNKTRLFMTALATAMGCAFLIVLASVGFGLQKSIVDDIVGDRLITSIEVYGKKEPDADGSGRITEADLAAFRAIDHVNAVTYRNSIEQTPEASVDGDALGQISVVALDFAAESRAGFELEAGTLPQSGNEVVVGYHIRDAVAAAGATEAETEAGVEAAAGTTEADAAVGTDADSAAELPAAADWIGRKMLLTVKQLAADGQERSETIEATVVGVVKKPARDWKKDSYVYAGSGLVASIEAFTGTQWGAVNAPATEGEGATPEQPGNGLDEPRGYNGVNVIADGGDRVKAVSAALDVQGFYSYSIVDRLEPVNLMFLIMKIGLVFVGTIAVLIASIGIFNTMTMAVTERAQDIGIMKAIGAHPSAIRRIFLLESTMIGLIGALGGTAVAYLISFAVNAGLPLVIENFMNEQVPGEFLFSYIPPYLAVLSCIISLGVAVLSGARPAGRATRIDVLRALRRDM